MAGEQSPNGVIELMTFEYRGFPVELLDERDWRRAVRAQRVQRGTSMIVYRSGEAPRRRRADEVAELRALLDELDPLPLAAEAKLSPWRSEEAGEGGSEGSPDGAADAADRFNTASLASAEETSTPTWEPEFAGEEQPSPLARTHATGLSGREIGGVLAIIVAVILVFLASALSNRGNGSNSTIAAEQTYQIASTANVRDLPTVYGSRIVGTLAPGMLVSGTVVEDGPGEDWIRIASDPYSGYYVWTGNLSPGSDSSVFNATQ